LNGNKVKTAFLFPGQASQYVGMANDIYEEFDSVRELFGRAGEILGFDIANTCFNGPEELLKQTSYTQPAVFLHSCSLDMILRENYLRPDGAAGHSLGEYTAMASAGTLSFEQALMAVAKRSKAMQDDCDKNPGTMAAVLGLEYSVVVDILNGINGVVVPANHNSADQTVISGELDAVEDACEKLKAAGAKRAIMLPVGGAYHSPLMSGSSELMKTYLAELNFKAFEFPIYSNVNAEPVSTPDKYKEIISNQITNPVLWSQTLKNMYNDGFRHFVEVGPGKVLQGLAKKFSGDPEIKISGIDKLDDLDEFINRFPRLGER